MSSVARARKISRPAAANPTRRKFLYGGIVIIAVVIWLIVTSTMAGAQFFYTVDELKARGSDAVGKPVRLAGAVLGDTIQYDPETLTLTFTVVHISADTQLINDDGGLAAALDAAVADPTRNQVQISYVGVKPDLLKHAAEAIVSGELGTDGVFHANELLLRCPTRYEEALPGQVES